MAKIEDEVTIEDELVMSKIFIIRNQKVMIDKDLAQLYGVETKQLKRQVKRNVERFPDDFMMELTEIEFENLRSQFGTSSWGGSKYLPLAFTKHGVLMLSSVLNSSKAIQINIRIMRIFNRIRKMVTDNTELHLAMERLTKKTENNTKNIEVVFQYIDELIDKKETEKPRVQIGYKIPKK